MAEELKKSVRKRVLMPESESVCDSEMFALTGWNRG